MRSILVITRQASLLAALEAVLDHASYQIIPKEETGEAEFLLARGAIDAAILDLELTEARALRVIAEFRQLAPACPLLVFLGKEGADWEEDAYLEGVSHVLHKPVRGPLLNTFLHRLFPRAEDSAPSALPAPPLALPVPEPAPARSSGTDAARSLEALRRFSALLGFGLESGLLLKNFLLLLREVLGVNRAVVFLRKPSTLLGEHSLLPDDRWLHSKCAIGLDQSVLEHFALSLQAGIGGFLHRHGRILRAGSADALANREIIREFQILGTQVAVPILDRHSLLGVAVFDDRLTGEPYTTEELGVLFQLLEEVGLALRNSWVHSQLEGNHGMITEILSRLGSGCVVVSQGLEVLHANLAAKQIFQLAKPGHARLEFGDLPQQLGSMVFTVIKTGVAIPAFKQSFAAYPDRHFRIAIVPFRTKDSEHTDAALLTVEDISEHERAQKLELEAGSLRIIKAMAQHLAHEIGNALVPLSTHQQMMKESFADADFQESLSAALAGGVKRISRLASQMNFLAREWEGSFPETIGISDLIVEAFHDAHTFHPGKKVAQLSFNKHSAPWKVAGDHKALRHAFSEVILNALQANPDSPTIAVDLQENSAGLHELQVEVRDAGDGFTEESATRAAEPFFTTRNVGLGIGLTVTRKIIESHHGRLEIPAPREGVSGIVRISLPIQN